MNVLVLSNNDGGLYLFRKELLERLVSNHRVICCMPNEDGYVDKIASLGCKCIILEFNRRGVNPIEDICIIKEYLKIIKRVKADIILTYTIKPNVYGGIAAQISKIPYIANVTGLGTTIENGGLLSKISLSMYRVGLRKALCVFFQNATNHAFFKRVGIVHGNTKQIPGSGVNLNTHYYEPYPVDDGCFRFLFVGRVMRDKGIEELLNAIEKMHSEGKNVFLDIVGGSDEDYSQIINLLEQKGIVKYHGNQNAVHDFYKKAQCVVLPSYHEGMANVLLEASATGRPVIATRIPGCQETFDDGISGYGCEVRNCQSLKAAMELMINTAWEKREKMGIAGREKMRSQFDRELIVNAYLEIIGKASGMRDAASR